MNIKKLSASAAAAALLLAGLPAAAQDINHVKALLRELQEEVARIESRQDSLGTPAAAPRTDTVIITRTVEVEKPQPVESLPDRLEFDAIDTLPSFNDAVRIILYNDNTWRYVRDKEAVKDSEIYTRYWDTVQVSPYKEVPLSALPASVAIDLVDSLRAYHYPYKGKLHPRGKFGPRGRRNHRGVDLPLKIGEPIYATFNGRVRLSQYNRGGYGHLVVIRHDNGLETYYGHLSERLVTPGQWVEAGQIIGRGGSTGRSTGPHLHFEVRYYGQTFDPQRIINFEEGSLRRETLLLKRSYFNIHSSAEQDWDDEDAIEKEAKAEAQKKYHRIRSGDTLGKLARLYGTTVTNICRMNNIKSTATLRIGQNLRVR